MTKQEIRFPVVINLKVVMTADEKPEENIKELDIILEKCLIPRKSEWKSVPSSAGKYASYTGSVLLETKEKMYALYAALKAHPKVKFAI